MTGTIRGKTMTLDNTSITLSDGDTGHIHFLPNPENFRTYDYTGLEAIDYLLPNAEFLKHMAGFHRSLGKVPCGRLIDADGAALAESDLHCGIAVRGWCLDLGNAIVGHIKYRDRLAIAIVGENTSHANLAADEP
jgi:hypothetical protein